MMAVARRDPLRKTSKLAEFHTARSMRAFVRAAQAAGQVIGFVPTMGALHAGHGALIRRAAKKCDVVVVSVFVNPTQFGPNEDLAKYPRTIDSDRALIAEFGGHALFFPAVDEMYPKGAATTVHVAHLTDGLCGPVRPGHFDGVALIVAKLFNIVPADYAFFGEKDFQQVAVIRQMSRDLDFPVKVVPVPTVREKDGLAMSSRNRYLSVDERAKAASIYAGLSACAARVKAKPGVASKDLIALFTKTVLKAAPEARMQYVEVVDPITLAPVSKVTAEARLIVALFLGTTRLIDNVALRV